MSALESYRELRTMADNRMTKQQEKSGVSLNISWCSEAVGAREVVRRIKQTALKYGLGNIEVRVVGCMGLCSHEPIMTVNQPGEKEVSYARVTPDMAEVIIRSHVLQGKIIRPWLIQ